MTPLPVGLKVVGGVLIALGLYAVGKSVASLMVGNFRPHFNMLLIILGANLLTRERWAWYWALVQVGLWAAFFTVLLVRATLGGPNGHAAPIVVPFMFSALACWMFATLVSRPVRAIFET